MAHNWNDIFDYDPATGDLRWKIKPCSKVRIGDIAGYKINEGYWVVGYEGRAYKTHRIIFEMLHGEIPAGKEIDHRNRIRDDNRKDNLRLATRSENNRNSSMQCNNTSGFVGVCWHKKTSKWEAYLRASNKILYLGVFTNKSDAYAARLKAEKEHHGIFAQSGLSV